MNIHTILEAYDNSSFKLTKDGENKSSFGKNSSLSPFTSVKDGMNIFTCYKTSTSFFEFVKKSDSTTEDRQEFIKRTAIYLAKLLRDNKIYSVVKVKGSSPLVDDIIKELKLRSYISESGMIEKGELTNIKFVPTIQLDDETIKKQNREIEKAIAAGKFNMKKISPKFRPFFRGFLKLTNIKEKDIINRNVCIIDDRLTSGSTFVEAKNLLTALNPSNIIGISIFK